MKSIGLFDLPPSAKLRLSKFLSGSKLAKISSVDIPSFFLMLWKILEPNFLIFRFIFPKPKYRILSFLI